MQQVKQYNIKALVEKDKESTSPHAADIVIVPRKYGKMIRFVVCREWSKATIVSAYPLQWTRRVHDALTSPNIFHRCDSHHD